MSVSRNNESNGVLVWLRRRPRMGGTLVVLLFGCGFPLPDFCFGFCFGFCFCFASPRPLKDSFVNSTFVLVLSSDDNGFRTSCEDVLLLIFLRKRESEIIFFFVFSFFFPPRLSSTMVVFNMVVFGEFGLNLLVIPHTVVLSTYLSM